jgi:hypothetical protein
MAEKTPIEPQEHPDMTVKGDDVEIPSLTPEEDKRILRRIDL